MDLKWMEFAKAELGVKEAPGPVNTPTVVAYYQDAVHQKQADSVPWCAAFVGAMLVRAGIRPSGSLLARSYLGWGERLTEPRYGCIVIFSRGKGMGHVAFFIEDNEDGTIKVLGGNQADAVNFRDYPKERVLGYRWPGRTPMRDEPKQEVA